MSEQAKKNQSGGSATAGGINFQAATSAIVYSHILDGSPLNWLGGLINDVPIALAAETGLAGDDIALEFADGVRAEAQVKKGLNKSKRLWEPLIELATAINEEKLDYGILVVCPESSNSIKSDLSKDIIRVGQGRSDNLKAITVDFLSKLDEYQLPHANVCKKIRIVVSNALISDRSYIELAKAKLATICSTSEAIENAWSSLYEDATRIIELRGRRDCSDLLQILTSNSVTLSNHISNRSPIPFINKVIAWSKSSYSQFSIFGIDQPLLIDDSWIPIKIIVQENNTEEVEDIEGALNSYHEWERKASYRDAIDVNPTTIGLYFRRCVIVAGPGMGKTTLLKKLFRTYNSKNRPSIIVRLPLLVARMIQTGASFEESIFSLGLDTAGVTAKEAIASNFKDWVLLFDGLDECGHHQESICQSIVNYTSSFPSIRAIITTRPVGYQTTLLKKWRHYEMLPLEEKEAQNNIELLICNLYRTEQEKLDNTRKFLKSELEKSKYSKAIIRSPLLMGLTVSLATQKISLGKTKTELYKNLFKLIEGSPSNRKIDADISSAVQDYFIGYLGWQLIKHPTASLTVIINNVSIKIKKELDCPQLKALSICETCAIYWEERGMIEKIHHSKGSLYTFIHKTFMEYAAGRYLASLSEDVLLEEISSLEYRPSVEEVLIFAGSLGITDSIANILLNKHYENKNNSLDMLIEITVSAEHPPSENIRDAAFKEAVNRVISLDKEDAYEYASKLIIACNNFPLEITKHTDQYINSNQYWTKLSCITISLIAETYTETGVLIEFFIDYYNRTRGSSLSSSLSASLVLGSNGSTKVNNAFVKSAVKHIFHNCCLAKAKEIFSSTILNNSQQSMSLIQDLEHFFRSVGHLDISKELYRFDYNAFPDGFNSREFIKRDIEAAKGLCNTLIIPSFTGGGNSNNNEPLLKLSAFLSASNYESAEFSDVLHWPGKSFHDPIREVFKGVTLASGISQTGLHLDAVKLLEKISSSDSFNSQMALFDRTVHIDIEPDWDSVRNFGLDSEKIEKAMYCGRRWIAWLAGNLLLKLHNKEDLISLIKRLLKNGEYNTLLITSCMIPYLDDNDEIRAAILNRLKDKLIPGCQFLYAPLANVIITLDQNVMDAVSKGLFKSGPITAIEAAKLAGKFSAAENEHLYKTLIEAYTFWVDNEEPYPTGGGVVPDSPRGELLTTLFKMKQPSNNDLMGYLSDPRRDVRDVAENHLISRIEVDTSLREKLISATIDETIDPIYLSKTIKKNTPFSPQQIDSICEMINHENSKLRYAAFNILHTNHVSNEMLRKWLEIAMKDANDEIRYSAVLLESRL
ncbi:MULTISPECIES: NACHT domain-containing protein [Serratia]|uniref:NACHT domain-containing protein n=1 Tax=Serratia TaxID=613 RepID=UPI0011AB813C|nr:MULTISPECIES: NACHT domain-containing protein [Serratia]MBL0903496.1 NACHT domain-containing protein [Serratia bockelmannii]